MSRRERRPSSYLRRLPTVREALWDVLCGHGAAVAHDGFTVTQSPPSKPLAIRRASAGFHRPHLVTQVVTVSFGAIVAEGYHFLCGGSSQFGELCGDTRGDPPLCRRCFSAWANGDCVYRFFDADGRLLYIGSTVAFNARITAHRQSPWWPHAASVQTEKHPSIADARAAEIRAIAAESPLYNRRAA